MEFTNQFDLSTSVSQAWPLLLDVENTAACMPGATVHPRTEDDTYDLELRVALGPMRLSYRGDLALTEVDENERLLVFGANVKEVRGGGRATATVRARLDASSDTSTRITIATELQISGRAAQMGRSVIEDVAHRMTDEFAECLAGRIMAPADREDHSAAMPPRAVHGFTLLLSVLRARVGRLFRRDRTSGRES